MKQLKAAVGTAKLSCTLFGTIVGAGFLSGAELVRFFPAEGYLSYVGISALLFAACFFLLYRCGKKYGGYAQTLSGVFGKAAPLFQTVMAVSSLIMCASMLAGLNAAAREGFGMSGQIPVVSLAVLPLLYGLSGRGVKGVFWVNLILVPFIFAFVFACAGASAQLGMRGESSYASIGLVQVIAYVSMNCFLAAPLICDAGAQGAGGGLGCALSALLIGVCTAILLNTIAGSAIDPQAEMPVLQALGSGVRLPFTLVCVCGILTTLLSSWYPLHTAMQARRGARLRRAALLAAAFVLSLLGLRPLIRFIYPLVGAAGAVFLAICARKSGLLFDKPLFGERDERVHSRGEHAEDGGCRHHEV